MQEDDKYWDIDEHISKIMQERGDTRDPHEVTRAYINNQHVNNNSKKD